MNMKGKSMKLRLCRVYKDRLTDKSPWQWFREYYNPRTQKKESRVSINQQNHSLMR